MSGATAAPRVSVVTAFLNEDRFLAETIESVFGQTFDDWELILVDDGSTDGSPAIARDYAERNPGRVRYLTHPGNENRGLSASRNAGISVARGEFVAFVDADDIWLPNKLAEQVEILDEHPGVGLLFGDTEYWWSWDPNASKSDRTRGLAVPADQVSPVPLLLQRIISNRYPAPCPSSYLARRKVIQAIGGLEDSFRTLLRRPGIPREDEPAGPDVRLVRVLGAVSAAARLDGQPSQSIRRAAPGPDSLPELATRLPERTSPGGAPGSGHRVGDRGRFGQARARSRTTRWAGPLPPLDEQTDRSRNGAVGEAARPRHGCPADGAVAVRPIVG
jgi:hypothetical protein